MLGFAGFALLQALAGALELHFVNSNLPTLEEKASNAGHAIEVANSLIGSSQTAIWAGSAAFVIAIVVTPFFRQARVWARGGAWLFCIVVFFSQIIAMLQDGSVGVVPYIDPSHDLAQQDWVNSLLVLPGYQFVIYPVESIGVIVPFFVGAKLLQEPVLEFFRSRKKVTVEQGFSVSDILANRGGKRELQ
jgi:hypothetical protein